MIFIRELLTVKIKTLPEVAGWNCQALCPRTRLKLYATTPKEEHPFGTIKSRMGYTHLPTKTLGGGRTEMSLRACLQHETNDQHYGKWTSDGSNASLKESVSPFTWMGFIFSHWKLNPRCTNGCKNKALLSWVLQIIQQKHPRQPDVSLELLYWRLSDFSHGLGR